MTCNRLRRIRWRVPALAAGLVLLSGCHAVLLDPAGEIARRQRDILLESTGLMLIIIIPVMALTVLFAWRYRTSNHAANYAPDWDHSIYLELMIWAAPLLIIICLGALTWTSTHLLDPFRALGGGRNTPAPRTEVLQVEAVALDWKWLFIYPQYGIATVNEMAAPLNRPIEFRITSSTVMNSFFIPALAGQIYAMPGMDSKLHAVANRAGDYNAFSANYSGAGFSDMHFTFHALAAADFDQWVSGVKRGDGGLDRATYLQLARPSENEPVHRYATVDASLYQAILDQCVGAGERCRSVLAAIDRGSALCTAPLAAVRQSNDPLSFVRRSQPDAAQLLSDAGLAP